MIKKCCVCLTCGQGTSCKDWFVKKSRIYRWKLRTQMFAGVCCSVACVFSTMAFAICYFAYLILDEYKTDFVVKLEDEETALIIQKAQMAAE